METRALNYGAVWAIINQYKVLSAKLPLKTRRAIWDECDAMMRAATNAPKHYGWYIG